MLSWCNIAIQPNFGRTGSTILLKTRKSTPNSFLERVAERFRKQKNVRAGRSIQEGIIRIDMISQIA